MRSARSRSASSPATRAQRATQLSVQNDSAEPDKRATVNGAGTMGYYLGGVFGEVSGFGDVVDHGDATQLDLNAAR